MLAHSVEQGTRWLVARMETLFPPLYFIVLSVLHCTSLHFPALCCQDVMARYARMAGKKMLWLPGTDHAGIATQVGDMLQKDT